MRNALLFLCCAFLVGCAARNTTTPVSSAPQAPEDNPVALEAPSIDDMLAENGKMVYIKIDSGGGSLIRNRIVCVVDSQEDWEKLWLRHVGVRPDKTNPPLPKKELPKVDFENEHVLAIFAGDDPDDAPPDVRIAEVSLYDGINRRHYGKNDDDIWVNILICKTSVTYARGVNLRPFLIVKFQKPKCQYDFRFGIDEIFWEEKK